MTGFADINLKIPWILAFSIFMSILNFMLSWVEIEKKFYNLGVCSAIKRPARILEVKIIRLLQECEVLIEKSLPWITVLHHEAPPSVIQAAKEPTDEIQDFHDERQRFVIYIALSKILRRGILIHGATGSAL